MKMPPPISAVSRMARGIVLRGSIVSSVNVVTASKPRNEYVASAAPPEIVPSVAPEWKNGCELASASPTCSTCLIESTTKKPITRIWNAISTKFAFSAILMPSTLRIVVSRIKVINQIQLGTLGNSAER